METKHMAAVLAATVALGLPAARAEVIWRGDFETGDLRQWSKAQKVSADRLTVVRSPVRQGQYALRVEVRQGDDPIDASGNRAELVWSSPEKEGHERWYAWSTLWPLDYPRNDTWQLFTQWHHTGNSGSPPVEFYVVGDEIRLRLGAKTVVWTTPLKRGVWHDFVFHVKWSANPSVGFVELWYDGKQVLPKRYGANMYEGQDNLLKQGLYRNESIAEVGVLYHDGMTVATRAEDVLPPMDAGGGSGGAGIPDAGNGGGASAPDAGNGEGVGLPDADPAGGGAAGGGATDGDGAADDGNRNGDGVGGGAKDAGGAPPDRMNAGCAAARRPPALAIGAFVVLLTAAGAVVIRRRFPRR